AGRPQRHHRLAVAPEDIGTDRRAETVELHLVFGAGELAGHHAVCDARGPRLGRRPVSLPDVAEYAELHLAHVGASRMTEHVPDHDGIADLFRLEPRAHQVLGLEKLVLISRAGAVLRA